MRKNTMKTKFLMPLIISMLALSACNSKPSDESKESKDQETESVEVLSEESESISESESVEESESEDRNPKRIEKNINIKLNGLYDSSKTYPLDFSFDSDFFFEDAKVFNKDLAMVSFGLSIAAANEQAIKAFHGVFNCEDTKYVNYDVTPSEDTLAYSVAKVHVNDQNLYMLAVRGFEYGAEWANNLEIGIIGNHAGFERKAKQVLADLTDFIGEDDTDYRLWMTGYSRGAAICNVMSHFILSEEEPLVKQENMFVYTFETPRGLAEENEIVYENVFNIVNHNDLVTHIAPKSYGLSRCGIDIDIYDENVAELLKAFDSSITLPEFSPQEDAFQNDEEFIAFLMNMFNPAEDEKEDAKDIKTREHYYDNFQPSVMYVVKLVFTLSDSTLAKIMEAIKALEGFQKLTILSEDGLYNLVKPILDEDGYEYVDEELRTNLNKVAAEMLPTCTELLLVVMAEKTDNLVRSINMHYPETAYVLLNNYAK